MSASGALGAMPALRTVRLFGALGARFGRRFELAVASPAEAVHALCVLLPGFKQVVASTQGVAYRVMVRGGGLRTQVRDEETLELSAGSGTQICIVPVVLGAKRAGLFQLIVGATLIVLSFTTGNPFMLKIGGALVLGGVAQLLSPQRLGSASTAEREVSAAINGPPNVTSEGGPVPLIIGRMIVGSVVASSGLSTDEFTPPASSLPPAPPRPPEEPPSWVDTNVYT